MAFEVVCVGSARDQLPSSRSYFRRRPSKCPFESAGRVGCPGDDCGKVSTAESRWRFDGPLLVSDFTTGVSQARGGARPCVRPRKVPWCAPGRGVSNRGVEGGGSVIAGPVSPSPDARSRCKRQRMHWACPAVSSAAFASPFGRAAMSGADGGRPRPIRWRCVAPARAACRKRASRKTAARRVRAPPRARRCLWILNP